MKDCSSPLNAAQLRTVAGYGTLPNDRQYAIRMHLCSCYQCYQNVGRIRFEIRAKQPLRQLDLGHDTAANTQLIQLLRNILNPHEHHLVAVRQGHWSVLDPEALRDPYRFAGMYRHLVECQRCRAEVIKGFGTQLYTSFERQDPELANIYLIRILHAELAGSRCN